MNYWIWQVVYDGRSKDFFDKLYKGRNSSCFGLTNISNDANIKKIMRGRN
ncbi:MAG: hypothetical protein LBV51_03810 [Acholeplasmatales bacterium]|nr:hypothetical protein [Acholeplasmatales bacterium]